MATKKKKTSHGGRKSSRSRKGRGKRKCPGIRRRLLILVLWLFGVGIFLASMLVLLVWLGAFGRLPEEAELKDVKQSNASLVFSSDGTLMGKYYRVNRESITNEAISPYVRQALIATEDNRFFEHHGVDVMSLARVFVKSMLMGDRDQGGGSTISQQLAKKPIWPWRSWFPEPAGE